MFYKPQSAQATKNHSMNQKNFLQELFSDSYKK